MANLVAFGRGLQLTPLPELRVAVIHELVCQNRFNPALKDERLRSWELQDFAGRDERPARLLFGNAPAAATPAAVLFDHRSIAGKVREKP
jgi:hypothetical protein